MNEIFIQKSEEKHAKTFRDYLLSYTAVHTFGDFFRPFYRAVGIEGELDQILKNGDQDLTKLFDDKTKNG